MPPPFFPRSSKLNFVTPVFLCLNATYKTIAVLLIRLHAKTLLNFVREGLIFRVMGESRVLTFRQFPINTAKNILTPPS